MSKSIIPELINEAPNRRSFVRKLGIAGAALGAASTLDLKTASAATTTDINVLNFALNLEYLEAEFYTVAVTGYRLSHYINVGPNPGQIMGGKKVAFTNTSLFTDQVAAEIGADERAHVALLRSALGSAAIDEPTINLDALGFGFNNENDFLKLARIFEDIGVTAYAGAAPLLSPTIVATAAKILVAEAEHVANIRLQVARLNIATAPPLDTVDILPPPSNPKHFFSLDSNGLAQTRTPPQVLYLAYGHGNVSSGGFFPDGVNGYFKTSSSTPA